MGFSSNTGMSFRTKLPSNSPRAGIRCSVSHSRTKDERNVTQQFFFQHSYLSMDDLLELAIEALTNGLAVPHRRRVFACDSEKRKVVGPLLVAIDIHEIEFTQFG